MTRADPVVLQQAVADGQVMFNAAAADQAVVALNLGVELQVPGVVTAQEIRAH